MEAVLVFNIICLYHILQCVGAKSVSYAKVKYVYAAFNQPIPKKQNLLHAQK
jgi:hypothetical protein